MDERKVCFICCTNDLMYEKECRLYLAHLNIPDGIRTEIKMIHDAVSMTEGYNRAMRASDAKYKVYLHQDVFVLNENFIEDILRVFEDEQIGMLGVVGKKDDLPQNGIIFTSWDLGRLKTNNSYTAFEMITPIGRKEKNNAAICVDGLLIATQYDLPWREDLFDGWDFYDASQSLEFKKAGFSVVVAAQKSSWCFHDDGYPDLKNYNHYREIFIREYGDYLKGDMCSSIVKMPLNL